MHYLVDSSLEHDEECDLSREVRLTEERSGEILSDRWVAAVAFEVPTHCILMKIMLNGV